MAGATEAATGRGRGAESLERERGRVGRERERGASGDLDDVAGVDDFLEGIGGLVGGVWE